MTTDTNDVMDDIAAEAAESPVAPTPPATMEAIAALAREMLDIDERIAKNEARIAELRTRRNKIASGELVDILTTLGMDDFSVEGRKFVLGNYFKASIPEEHRAEAHAWLEEHGAGDIITNNVIATFPKGFEDESKKLLQYITENYQMATAERTQMVPWARLTSWLRELWLAEDPHGQKVLPPLDIMGATVGRVVTIKLAKKRA